MLKFSILMNKKDLLNELIKIHNRYSYERNRSTETSQFLSMWSTDNPPDWLVGTDPLEDICDLFDMNIDEEYVNELYDMTLKEAAESLYGYLQSD